MLKNEVMIFWPEPIYTQQIRIQSMGTPITHP